MNSPSTRPNYKTVIVIFTLFYDFHSQTLKAPTQKKKKMHMVLSSESEGSQVIFFNFPPVSQQPNNT
jgi:hypothetical protein